jgi:hypothetical protein
MKDPYLKEGRLADVIAAVQVMASAKRPEGKITNWVESLEGKVNKRPSHTGRAFFKIIASSFLCTLSKARAK